MKKFLYFLFFALCLTVAANAQPQTLTVGDPPTYYNGAFPINGFWLDSEGTLSQFIIPAESLADMDGGTISKMIFYTLASYYIENDDTYSPDLHPSDWLHESGAVFSVALSEVSATEFVSGDNPSGYDHSSLTEVYHGTFPESIDQLEIEFDNPYPYHGGNLLVSIIVEEGGNYGTCYWIGVSDEETNLSYCQYDNYNELIFSTNTFLPKTTFEYVLAPCVISEIEITGFTAPEWGEHPDNEMTVPEDANYTLGSAVWVSWDEANHQEEMMTTEDVFDNEDVVYYMYFQITPKEGCTFVNPYYVTVTIDDNSEIVEGKNMDEGIFYAWTEEYTVTLPCVINTIEITGFTEPVYGATPDFDVEVPADADYTLDNVLWAENNGEMTAETFEANLYFMVFDIAPNEGCTFADNLTVTINNDASLVDTYWCEFLSNGDYRVFTIEYYLSAPPCDAPSDLSVTDITSNSATVEWTGDMETYNVKYIRGTLFEDFESGLPSGWTTIDNDADGYDWYEHSLDGEYSHSGTTVMTSESYINNYGALYPDNWLITPQIELGNTLRVWLNGQDPNGYDKEHFAIYLSTTGNSVSDFTTTLVGETETTHEWTEYTADLSAYAGQQGYIAIRHFNVTDQFRLNVDDFGIFLDDDWTTVTATDNFVDLTGLDPETPYIVQVQGICEYGVSAWTEHVEFTTEEETEEPCEAPTNLTATNITATSAKLGWTGNLEQYIVRYKDDAASDWTTATTANSTLALTGLTPATTYTAQVQGDCGSGAKSVTDWSDPVTFTTLSGTVEPGECGPAEDCDGISYPTVKIGDVCWMTKNLAAETCVTTGNVYSYVNDQFPDEDANVETYGLLYDEEAAFATGICPEGYTLPTTEQFEYLKNNFTVEELRNGTGWIVNTGTNGTGFSWDGSGFRNGTSETFEHMLMEGYLWAVDMTSGTPQPAMYKMMYYCNEIVRVYDFNGISASIRCVKNAEPQPEPETFTCGTDNLIIGENSYETVQIGTQCWTKTNMREIVGEDATSSHATSIDDPLYYKVPLKDVALYGYLYNWKAATMVCPTGWHLPSHQEWITMEQGLTTEDVSSTETGEYGHYAGKLATTADWLDDDTHPAAPGFTGVYDDRNVSGFSAIPAGYHTNGFLLSDANANFWTSTVDETNSEKAYSRCLYYYAEYVGRYKHPKYMGESVRCVRDAEPGGEEPISFNCGTDELIIGENHYPTVQIGTQCWTKTNLRETKDKNGNDFIDGISAAAGSFDEYEDAMIYIPTEETWSENNSSVTYDENTFGYYYNWVAANNVCPDGWHLPSDEEWTQMEDYVSNAQEGTEYIYRCDQSDATSIAKALASETDVWSSYAGECYPGDQSEKSNNATGFSAVPAGSCSGSLFYNASYGAYFWSATQNSNNYANYRALTDGNANVGWYYYYKSRGYSVRCLRDAEE